MSSRLMERRQRLKRQRRVARIKRAILFTMFLLFVIPIVMCGVLFFKTSKMQKQLNTVIELQKKENYTAKTTNDISEDDTISLEKNRDESDASENQTLSQETVENLTKEDTKEKEEYADSAIEGKKVYLTFDDGPSKNTEKILNILKKYNVKATFFVIGKTTETSFELYKKIADEGHTLAMHSYSHDYDKIYKSTDAFLEDTKKIKDLLTEKTGVEPTIYRFPGGSSNKVSNLDMKEFIKCLNEQNITYFDWNVVNGDATGKQLAEKEMIQNIVQGVEQYESSIVLMHDTDKKEKTLNTLETVIQKLLKQDVTFLAITEQTKPVQHVKSDSVK